VDFDGKYQQISLSPAFFIRISNLEMTGGLHKNLRMVPHLYFKQLEND